MTKVARHSGDLSVNLISYFEYFFSLCDNFEEPNENIGFYSAAAK